MPRVIVSGTRKGTDVAAREWLFQKLHELAVGGWTGVEGGAGGVDSEARSIARYHGLEVETVEAKWDEHGRAAGPIRNQAMIDRGADLVLALPGPGSKGTIDMIKRALAARINVEVFHVR